MPARKRTGRPRCPAAPAAIPEAAGRRGSEIELHAAYIASRAGASQLQDEGFFSGLTRAFEQGAVVAVADQELAGQLAEIGPAAMPKGPMPAGAKMRSVQRTVRRR